MKCQSIYTWVILSYCTVLCAMLMAKFLSQCILIGLSYSISRSCMIFIHNISQISWAKWDCYRLYFTVIKVLYKRNCFSTVFESVKFWLLSYNFHKAAFWVYLRSLRIECYRLQLLLVVDTCHVYKILAENSKSLIFITSKLKLISEWVQSRSMLTRQTTTVCHLQTPFAGRRVRCSLRCLTQPW